MTPRALFKVFPGQGLDLGGVFFTLFFLLHLLSPQCPLQSRRQGERMEHTIASRGWEVGLELLCKVL